MRDAYAGVSWSFGRGEGVEQCQREHYAEHLDSQRREGCRIQGIIQVNKVVGNFHFAPGKSFSNGNMHVHDLDNYMKDGTDHTFSHTVHQLRFGPSLPDEKIKTLSRSGDAWSNHHVNPLDGTTQITDEKAFNYMYFIKVVSTAYLPLGWERKSNSRGGSGSIETHQYSVTSHKRSVHGGDDAGEGHKERLHAKGGIPGVFFSYVSSNPAFSQSIVPMNMLTLNSAGYLPHEGHQPRNSRQDLLWFPRRRRRCHRWDADRRGDGGSLAVRGPSDCKEASPGLRDLDLIDALGRQGVSWSPNWAYH